MRALAPSTYPWQDLNVLDPFVDIEKNLLPIMGNSQEAVDDSFGWIETNVQPDVKAKPEFVRLLATLILRAVTSKTSLADNIKRSEAVRACAPR